MSTPASGAEWDPSRPRPITLPAILLITILALPGCNRHPESYPPPIQRGGDQTYGFYRQFIGMNDADASTFLIKDIGGLENGTWRWSGPRPELRFVLQRVENLKFTMDFSISEVTFKQTGPVTVSFFVNGQLLDKVRYTTSGEKHFSKAVDPAWLKINEDTIVAAEIQPPWVSSENGMTLGIILVQAGFVD